MGTHVAIFYSAHGHDLAWSVVFTNICLISFFSFAVIYLLVFAKCKKWILMTAILGLFAYYMWPSLSSYWWTFQYLLERWEIKGSWALIIQFIVFLMALGFLLLIGLLTQNSEKKMIFLFMIISLYPVRQLLLKQLNLQINDRSPDPTDHYNSHSSLQIDDKKNIYFILMDSYTSVEGLKVLGLDKNPFLEQLEDRDFTIYSSFFTNFQTTRYAMSSYFSMSLVDPRYRIWYKTQRQVATQIINGQGLAYQILRDNGYQTHLIHESSYLIDGRCYADFCFPKPAKKNRYLALFDRIVLRGWGGFIFDPNKVHNQSLDSFTQNFDRVLKKVSNAQSDDPYYFTYLHLYLPSHADFTSGKDATRLKRLSNTPRGLTWPMRKCLIFFRRFKKWTPKLSSFWPLTTGRQFSTSVRHPIFLCALRRKLLSARELSSQ